MTDEDSATDLSRFLEWKSGFDARLEETKKPGFDKGKLKDGRSNGHGSATRSPAGPSTSKSSGSTGIFPQANSVPLTTSFETTSGLQGYSGSDGSGRDKQVVTSEGPSVLTIQLVDPDPVSIFKAMRAAYSSLVRNIFDKCFYLHFPKVEELVEKLRQYKKQVQDTFEEQYGPQLISEAWEDLSYWIFVQENHLLGQNLERQAKFATIYQFLKKAVIDFGERLNAGNISEYGVTRDVLKELMSRNVIKNQITQLFGQEWIKVYNGRRLEICGSVQQCIRLVQQYKIKVESMFDANQLLAVSLEELKRIAEEDLEILEAALDKVPGTGIFVYCFENLANEIYRSFKDKAEKENRNWDQAVQYATECYVDFMMETVGDDQDIPEHAVMKRHEEIRAKVSWAFHHVSGFLYSKIWTMDGVSDDILICQFRKVQEVRVAAKRVQQQESRRMMPKPTVSNEASTADLDETALVIDEDQKNDDDEEARNLVEMWNQVAEEMDSKPKFQKPILADSAATVEEELIEEPMDDDADSSDSDGIDAADVLSNIEYESCESDADTTPAVESESTAERTQKDLTSAAKQVESLETISSQEAVGANQNSTDFDMEEGEIMSPIRGPSPESDRDSPALLIETTAMTRNTLPQNKSRAETTSRERNKPESSRRKRAFSPIRPPSPGPVSSPIQSESSITETEVLETTPEVAISMIITSQGVYVTCSRDGEKPQKIWTPRLLYVVKSEQGLPQLSDEASLAAELLDIYDLLINRDKIRLFSTQYWIDGEGHFLYAEEALALYFTRIKSQINSLYSLQFQREWIAITVPVTMPSAGRTRLKTALELAGMPNTVIVQTTTALVLNEPEVYPGCLLLAIVILEDLIEVAVIQKVGDSFVTRAVKASPGATNIESLDKAPLIQRIYANMVQACEVADIPADYVKKCLLTINNRRSTSNMPQIWKGLRALAPKLHIKVLPIMPVTLGAGLRRVSKWKMNPSEDQEFLYQEVSPWTIEIDFGPGVSNCKLIEANTLAEFRLRPVILKRLRHGCTLKIIRSMFCSVSSFSMAKSADQELEFSVGTWKSRYPNAIINISVDSQGLISLELDDPKVKADNVVMELNFMPLDKKTVRDAARRLQVMVSSAEKRPTTLKPIVQTVKRIKLHLEEDDRVVVMND